MWNLQNREENKSRTDACDMKIDESNNFMSKGKPLIEPFRVQSKSKPLFE